MPYAQSKSVPRMAPRPVAAERKLDKEVVAVQAVEDAVERLVNLARTVEVSRRSNKLTDKIVSSLRVQGRASLLYEDSRRKKDSAKSEERRWVMVFSTNNLVKCLGLPRGGKIPLVAVVSKSS